MSDVDAARCVERLVREYGERAYQFAYRLCGNSEEAQDLVQEAYRRVLARWDQYDPGQPLENWFFTILRHLFLDGAKRYERTHVVSIDASVDGGASWSDSAASVSESLSDGAEPVEAVLERKEEVETVRAALGRLSYEHRAVLILSDMEGMNYEDMAHILGCPPGTVRSRVSRARTVLRRFLTCPSKESAVL